VTEGCEERFIKSSKTTRLEHAEDKGVLFPENEVCNIVGLIGFKVGSPKPEFILTQPLFTKFALEVGAKEY